MAKKRNGILARYTPLQYNQLELGHVLSNLFYRSSIQVGYASR